MRAITPNPSDDRIALGWPRIVGAVAQAIHYRWRDVDCLHRGPNMVGAACSIRILPTPGMAVLCRHGEAAQQLRQRYRLALGLALLSSPGPLAEAVGQRRVCCVTNRVLALCLARMCGDATDAPAARRQLQAMLLLVAPDKMQGLAVQAPGEEVPHATCRDAIQTLMFFRSLLEDPQWAAAIFAPGRLDYGQDGGPLGTCLAATFSALAAWVALAWAACQRLRGGHQAVRRGVGALALAAARRPSPSRAARLGSALRPRLGAPKPKGLKGLDGVRRALGDADRPSALL